MKKTLLVFLALAISLSLIACGTDNGTGSESKTPETSASSENSASSDVSNGAETSKEAEGDDIFSKFDLNVSEEGTAVTMSGTSFECDGVKSEKVFNIKSEGTYVFSGEMTNGQIVVEVDKTEKVRIVLKNASIHCGDSAPIWVRSADKVSVTLAEGSVNKLTDGGKYTYDNADEEPNACLFSTDDLTVNGSGTLTVTTKANNGICSKDDLKVVGATLVISAKNNGIKGNDSVTVRGGKITISQCDDGIKTTNEKDDDKGYIYIENGDITIHSSDDALQATRNITIVSGIVNAYAKGDAVNCDGTVDIANGTLNTK